jgi:hypothetical protein
MDFKMALSKRSASGMLLPAALLCAVLCNGIPTMAQDKGDSYNGEAGAYGLYIRYPGVDADRGKVFGYGMDFTWSFMPLRHDLPHRTAAAKEVVEKHWMSASGQIGPQYSDGPETFAVRVMGAGLVTDRFGIGGVFSLQEVSWMTANLPSVEAMNRSTLFGVFGDIYASPTVLLRELISYGSYTQLYDGRQIGGSLDILQYEHHLAITDGDGFGYIHDLIVYALDGSHRLVTFNQYFEAAMSMQFSIVPQLLLRTYIPDRGSALWEGGVGLGFQLHFTPRVLAQLVPVYSIDLKNEENDALSARLRVAARF